MSTNKITCSFTVDRDIYNAYKSIVVKGGENVKGNLIRYMLNVINYETPNADTISAIKEVEELNKKLKKLARKSALAVKASANAVKVVEDFTFEAPKTKQMVALMNNLQVNNGRLLLVLGNGVNENVLLSARNLQNVEVMRVSDIATYNVMKAKNLVLVESSVEGLNEMFNLN